ncbi:TetR/AcrR family transcriptional regulator [Nocardioides sp. SYSU DS0651]|uniref:TetR/AcrR family transcriptional regulator n=1 Tax=Nocardioides sp. SYSU DS0651 TaxID=3415955 RepID=UPI003F4C6FEE
MTATDPPVARQAGARQARADGARARLLEAAVAAFGAKGFHGTTTRDIAGAAGMSPAALYVHHRSKEELLYLISVEGHQRILELLREVVAATDGPTRQIRELVFRFARRHAREHTWARVVNYELRALAEDHLAEVMELRRQINREVRAVVEAGAATGEFTTVADASMTTVALLSLGIDIARWYDEDGRWSPDEVAELYAGLALRMVGAQPA